MYFSLTRTNLWRNHETNIAYKNHEVRDFTVIFTPTTKGVWGTFENTVKVYINDLLRPMPVLIDISTVAGILLR